MEFACFTEYYNGPGLSETGYTCSTVFSFAIMLILLNHSSEKDTVLGKWEFQMLETILACLSESTNRAIAVTMASAFLT